MNTIFVFFPFSSVYFAVDWCTEIVHWLTTNRGSQNESFTWSLVCIEWVCPDLSGIQLQSHETPWQAPIALHKCQCGIACGKCIVCRTEDGNHDDNVCVCFFFIFFCFVVFAFYAKTEMIVLMNKLVFVDVDGNNKTDFASSLLPSADAGKNSGVRRIVRLHANFSFLSHSRRSISLSVCVCVATSEWILINTCTKNRFCRRRIVIASASNAYTHFLLPNRRCRIVHTLTNTFLYYFFLACYWCISNALHKRNGNGY